MNANLGALGSTTSQLSRTFSFLPAFLSFIRLRIVLVSKFKTRPVEHAMSSVRRKHARELWTSLEDGTEAEGQMLALFHTWPSLVGLFACHAATKGIRSDCRFLSVRKVLVCFRPPEEVAEYPRFKRTHL